MRGHVCELNTRRAGAGGSTAGSRPAWSTQSISSLCSNTSSKTFLKEKAKDSQESPDLQLQRTEQVGEDGSSPTV